MPDFTVTLTAGQISKIQELRDDARAQAGDNTITSQQYAKSVFEREWKQLKHRQRSGANVQEEIAAQQADDAGWNS